MSIGGKKREQTSFENNLEVGLFVAEVVAVNPSIEEYKEVLGMELKEDNKATEYLGESKEGNTTLRVDFWLKETKRENKLKKVSFFLENKERTNKDGSKKQYINSIGSCSWADDENNLPDWFKKREYRVAYTGEEDLYNFMRTWLGKLDFKDSEALLQLKWKDLMKGNVKDIKEQIGGEYLTPVVCLATVKTVDKEDGTTKDYQGVYNKAFLPEFALKQFRLVDYSKQEVIDSLKRKKSNELKPHERFVLQVTGEYGVKEAYLLKDIQEYNPADFLVSSDKVISEDGSDY